MVVHCLLYIEDVLTLQETPIYLQVVLRGHIYFFIGR
jgi:hypothetical protein